MTTSSLAWVLADGLWMLFSRLVSVSRPLRAGKRCRLSHSSLGTGSGVVKSKSLVNIVLSSLYAAPINSSSLMLGYPSLVDGQHLRRATSGALLVF